MTVPAESLTGLVTARASTFQNIMAILAVLVAASCDSVLYVCSERALSAPGGPTANELTYVVAIINLTLTGLYILGYTTLLSCSSPDSDDDALVADSTSHAVHDTCGSKGSCGGVSAALGNEPPSYNLAWAANNETRESCWEVWVADPIANASCKPGIGAITGVWVGLGLVMWMHYQSFYMTIDGSNAVAAGVNKAMQSASVFFAAHLVFCNRGGLLPQQCRNGNDCLNAPKVVSACIVLCGTVLYSLGKPKGGATTETTQVGAQAINGGVQRQLREPMLGASARAQTVAGTS